MHQDFVSLHSSKFANFSSVSVEQKNSHEDKILKISSCLDSIFLFLQIPTICLSSEAIKLKIEDVAGLLWNDLTVATTIGNLITEQKENSVSSSNRFIVQT